MTQRAQLTVQVTDGAGRPLARRALAAWLRSAAPRGAAGHVVIALVSDRAMRRLNRTFRRIDRPTDVLSFPGERATGRRSRVVAPTVLGDIAIATGVAARQAQEHGHSLATELRVLALHGLLHLMGYDHHTDDGEMRRLEDRIRRRVGLPVGLISRASEERPPTSPRRRARA